LEIEVAKVGLKWMTKRQNIWLRPGMIGRFVTWGKAWQLATNTNDVTLYKYNEESKLQIGAFWTAQPSAVESPFALDKIHHSQDFDPPSPALRQWDVGVDQKGREPIARFWEEVSPNDIWSENQKWCLPWEGTTTNSIKSLTVRIFECL
jgi:hypothetical protein